MTRDAQFLFEIGTMRHIARTWKQFAGTDFANLAEHTMRVAWIAMIIGKAEGADLGKLARLALVHDMSETRAGDAHYLSRMYVKRDEDRAVADTSRGTLLEQDIQELWAECKAKQTLEAKIIKDADNLDVDLELREQAAAGSQLGTVWAETRKAVFERLYTETAKKLFQQIYATSPHDWHLEADNRWKAGDWSGAVKKEEETV